MNLQKKLQNLGIEQAKKLDDKQIRTIATNVTETITNAFPVIYNEYNNILIKLLNCNMYTAKITKPISKVNYIYENNSIYFDESLDLNKVNEHMIHECIHYLQDRRNTKGKLNRIGLCNFENFSVYGLGINEAANQYISAKCVHNPVTTIEKYGIRIKTISPNYYPFLTNLIEQIVNLIGDDVLVRGTINGSIEFEDQILNTFEANTKKIINQFDNIIEINNKLNLEKDAEKIQIYQEEIAAIYIDTQNNIFSTFFEKLLPRLTTYQEVNFYIDKAICCKNIMGVNLQERFSLNSFYDIQLEEIISKYDKKKIEFSNKRKNNMLAVITDNKLTRLVRKIIAYFSSQKNRII